MLNPVRGALAASCCPRRAPQAFEEPEVSDRTETIATLHTLLGQLSARQDWPALLQAARSAAQAFPTDWEIAYHEGRALLETGAFAEAETFLHGCMERFPTLPQFLVLFCYVGGRSLSPDAALERWATMHARMPLAPGLNLGLAQAYKAAGQMAEAERFVTGALQHFPGNLPMLTLHADLASQRQDWAEAASRWARLRELAPDRLDGVIGEVGALRQLGRLDEAEALAAEAVRRFPDNADLLSSYAAVAAARQDWRDAADRLRRLLALSPGNLPAALGLVGALQRQGLLEEAEQVAAGAIALHPDNEAMLSAYAAIASHSKRWDKAVQRWQMVYDRCPARVSTYHAYIRALVEDDKLVKAEEIAAEAIGYAPQDRALLMQHATIAERRLDVLEAQSRWTAVKRKFPDDEEVAECLQRAKRLMRQETQRMAKDQMALAHAPIRGSMRPPLKPQGPPRPPPSFGPTALDVLLTGAPAPEELRPPPGPTRNQELWGKIKKMFRGP
jgi:tetratricopeptide (TPR) repeat protein